MGEQLTILGFAGSLRKQSVNRAILRAAVELAPPDARIEIFELDGIPPFNQDDEQDPPAKVGEFKQKIRAADAILIVTPEYNYSMPGVLKNAIDWASRPYGDSAFDGKPAGIMGGSVGMLGTARAQYHLRQSCVFLNMLVMNRPEVMVPAADKKIDGNGRLADEATRNIIQQFLIELVEWTRKMKK
ncbi:NAD(P)H-dependent oxidoreductase [bacterium]|nr:NAD(P)H-dependent oxidoreductase [bacterium]